MTKDHLLTLVEEDTKELVNLKFKDAIVFDSRYRVNWRYTNENIRVFVNKAFPSMELSGKAMLSADLERKIRRWVKRYTVKLLYHELVEIPHYEAQ